MKIPRPLRYILGWGGMIFPILAGLFAGAILGANRAYTDMIHWMRTGKK